MSGGIHLRNTERGYGAVAKLLHWIIALLVIGMLVVGYTMVNLLEKGSSDQVVLYQWHKAVGLSVLGLILLRLLWRSANVTPHLPESVNAVERAGARLTHWGFYLLLIIMPVSGLLVHSTSRQREFLSPWILEWFPFLRELPVSGPLHKFMEEVHEITAWVILAVLLLHVAAALRHHIFKKDDVLRRMLPGHKP